MCLMKKTKGQLVYLYITLTEWPLISKNTSAAKQTTFQADLPSQFVYSGALCSPPNVCRGCVKLARRQAASLPAESVFFSIEIKINSRGVHRNVLVSVMDISPFPCSTLLTFLLNLPFFCCLASQQENQPCMPPLTLQTHVQGAHTHTPARTKRQTNRAMHNRCVMTGLIWFPSLRHDALYRTRKKKETFGSV